MGETEHNWFMAAINDGEKCRAMVYRGFMYGCNSRRWVQSSICLSGCATRWLRSRRTVQPCLRPSRTWAGSFSAVRLWPPPCESHPPAQPTSLLPSPALVCPSQTLARGEAPTQASSGTTQPAPGHRGRARGPPQDTSALSLPWWSANAEKFNCLSQKNCFASLCRSVKIPKRSKSTLRGSVALTWLEAYYVTCTYRAGHLQVRIVLQLYSYNFANYYLLQILLDRMVVACKQMWQKYCSNVMTS